MADPIIGNPDPNKTQDQPGGPERPDVPLGNADPDALIGPAAGGGARGGPGGGQGAGGDDMIVDGSEATFQQDVLEGSLKKPVIVDFWAPWCGPCKQLGPALEKAVKAAGGKVKLVKIDVDQAQGLAQQLRIQSIPMVYAFAGGRPVDGFQGALPESELKQFVDKLVAVADQLGGEDGGQDAGQGLEAAYDQADQAVQAGDHATAAAIYGQILEHAPEERKAAAKLALAYAKMGEADAAQEVLGQLPEGAEGDPEISGDVAAAKAAVELAAKASEAAGKIDGLKARVEADPKDHQARYELAEAQASIGEHEAAIDNLLDIIMVNKDWNEGAARDQLLKIFEALGPSDPLVASGRRRLSSLLFS